MHYAVYCIDKPDSFEMRNDYRAEHRDYLNSQLDRIFFSGPLLADDGILQLGSLFILSVASRADAEDFIGREPYNRVGVFETVTILRMRKGRYQPQNLCEEQEAPLRFDPFAGSAETKDR